MAWRRPGDKPLSEPMLVRSLTHICVTRPQWVNKTTVEDRARMTNFIPGKTMEVINHPCPLTMSIKVVPGMFTYLVSVYSVAVFNWTANRFRPISNYQRTPWGIYHGLIMMISDRYISIYLYPASYRKYNEALARQGAPGNNLWPFVKEAMVPISQVNGWGMRIDTVIIVAGLVGPPCCTWHT